ncbi:MAG TPA: DUF4384 domain-containing protein [Pyrinomonadaceae bacterium]|jgi:hypothetical protein
MWHRRFAPRFLACALGLLLSNALAGATLQAQDDTPSWNKTPSKTKPVPSSPAAPAPARTPKRPPATNVARRTPRAPLTLLSVQYRILKVEQNGSQIEVNPITVFRPGERIRFSVKTDTTDAYLYIIRQRDPSQPGKIVFPDAQVNDGQHFLRRGQEFFVPSGCPQGTTSWDCTYTVGAESGQDFYTLVFSRDAVLNLPVDALTDGGDIKPQALRQHWVRSRQKLSEPQRGDTAFSLRVRNLNRNADEELILRYVLNKRSRAAESK